MTPQEIRDAITASPELQALVPDTVALAAALSQGRTRWKPTEIGKGTIIQVLGLATANSVLDAVLATPDYRHVKELLEQGRLRLDVVAQAGLLQPLVAAQIMTQSHLDTLTAVAQEPAPVDEYSIRVALFADDGSLLV
jgi:hypothetical protein